MPTATSPVTAVPRPLRPPSANSATATPSHNLELVGEPGEASERLVECGRRGAGDRAVDGEVDLGELVQRLGGDPSPGALIRGG